MKFKELFQNQKPLIGMIHTNTLLSTKNRKAFFEMIEI